MTATTDADGVTSLYAYDDRGRRTHTAIDINQNGTIDFGGTDRITKVEYDVAQRDGLVVNQTATSVWRDNIGEQLLSVSQQSVDGLQSWSSTDGVTSHQQTVITGDGAWTMTTTHGDLSKTIQTYVGGRLDTSVNQKADGSTLNSVSYGWDDHGRLETSTDARNGTTTRTWYDSNELESITTPAPGVGGGTAQTTSYTYDGMGRTDIITLPDTTQVDNDYYLNGPLQRTSGSRTYSREYTYDSAGRQLTLTTNPGTAEAQLTEWTIDPVSGWLENKTIAGALTASYTYTTAGRVDTRTNGRNIVTDYDYNSAGEVETITYSDGTTPSVAYTYRRTGDVHTVTHAGSVYTYDYGLPGEKEKCTIVGGILDGAVIDPGYDGLHRRNTLVVTPGNGAAGVSQSWNYQAGSSRLDTVSQGDISSQYTYEPNSNLIKSITHRNAGIERLVEGRVYDNLNRLYSIGSVHKSFTYTYNDANQRTRVDREDGTLWDYGYDGFGHLTSAVKKQADESLLAGHQFGYNYDSLGNRTSSSFGGDTSGSAGLQSVSYTPNSAGDRNQYRTIGTPGVVLTNGKADVDAAITVNGEPAQDRQGEFFSHQTAVANENGPVQVDITVTADDGTNQNSITRSELVNPSSVSLTYDDDGNLTFDGYRDYTWDAENRLLSVQTRSDMVPNGAKEIRVEYVYDYLSRRIQSRTSEMVNGQWFLVKRTSYLYDGWNVIAELEGNPNSPQLSQSYLWGIDLSGTAQGAGSVGGLLAVQKHTGSDAGSHFVSYDGNGNVMTLASADDGSLSASYEYDAFGNLLAMSGVFAQANPYRFSTKPLDTGGLYYYGYRWYDAGNGRWLSRDPIEEEGGLNLYGFVRNDGATSIDLLGMTSFTSVLNADAFYTWHMGWLDKLHYNTYDGDPLKGAWNRLKRAKVGETVCICLQMTQGLGPISSKVVRTYSIKVGSNPKNQLLHAWHDMSHAFETKQGSPLQTLITPIAEYLKKEQEKVPSGFSSEDLVSNLIRFYAVVDEEDPEELIKRHAGVFGNDRKSALSKYVSSHIWRLGHPVKPGYEEWKPDYANNSIFENGPVRFQRAITQMRGREGASRFPVYFETYKPESNGVSRTFGPWTKGGRPSAATPSCDNYYNRD